VIKPLRIHRLAEDELADASSWYEVKQPGLGISLLNLIDETVERVRSGRFARQPCSQSNGEQRPPRLAKKIPLLNCLLRSRR